MSPTGGSPVASISRVLRSNTSVILILGTACISKHQPQYKQKWTAYETMQYQAVKSRKEMHFSILLTQSYCRAFLLQFSVYDFRQFCRSFKTFIFKASIFCAICSFKTNKTPIYLILSLQKNEHNTTYNHLEVLYSITI